MINLYYETIFKGWPLPNCGLSSKWKQGKYFGYNIPSGVPINTFNNFYYLAIKNKANPVLFTKDRIVENTYYPIELKLYGNKNPMDLMPRKTLKRLIKGHLKLLLIVYDSFGFEAYSLLKEWINRFKSFGVENITVVTDELKGVYKNYLDCKVLSFDYNQVKAQAILRHPKDRDILIKGKSLDFWNYDPEKFNPIHTFYSFDNSHSIHRLCLLSELAFRQLPQNYNNVTGLKYTIEDPLIYDKFRSDLENTELKKYLEYLMNNSIDKIETIQQHQNSLISIHTQPRASLGNILPEEANALHTDYRLWQFIYMAKPFITLGGSEVMRYLNNEGYFTFPTIIHEAYDRISSIPKKVKAIGEQVSRIDSERALSIKSYNNEKRNYLINRDKLISKDHLSRFINLYDNIQYR